MGLGRRLSLRLRLRLSLSLTNGGLDEGGLRARAAQARGVDLG